MDHTFSTDRPEWIWLMRQASGLLAVGSALLLGASLLGGALVGGFVFFAFAFVFIALTVVGVLIQLFGWMALAEGSSESSSMRVVFAISVIGFLVSVLLFLVAVPSPGFFVLGGGWILIPFSPMVFGPVVLGHGILFLLARQRIRRPGRFDPIVAGSVALLAIATVALGLALGTSLIFPGPYVWLAGLTSAGYGLIALGLSQEYERRRTPLPAQWYATQ